MVLQVRKSQNSIQFKVMKEQGHHKLGIVSVGQVTKSLTLMTGQTRTHTHTNLLVIEKTEFHRGKIIMEGNMHFGKVKKSWKSSTFRTCLACFVITTTSIKEPTLHFTAYTIFITITTTLLHFASTSKHKLQEVNSAQLISTSFPTLVPFNQSGKTWHNLMFTRLESAQYFIFHVFPICFNIMRSPSKY